MRTIKHGATDQSTVIRIIDSTTGAPEQAVEHGDITLWYRREGGSVTSITPASLAAANSAHADGGIEHLDDGYYRVDLPDAACATGAAGVLIGGSVASMIVQAAYHPLSAFVLDDGASPADVAGAVWDKERASHTTAGTFGQGAASVQGNVTGSVASVSGAVGSVTGNVGGNVAGSVGSVTGAVGSVTGNIGGNLAGSVGSVTGAVGSVTGNVGGNVAGSVGSVTAEVTPTAASKTGYRLSSTGVADVWAYVVEGTWTAVQYMRLMAAALAAKMSGLGTTTVTIRDVDDTKDRMVVTVDADGNRSAFGTRDGA
jgi:hypothetical protein